MYTLWKSGSAYVGSSAKEWKADWKEGRGTCKFANGDVEVSCFKADAPVGEGAMWSADGQTAWRVQDGKRGESISLEEAARIAARVGEPVPSVARTSDK